MAVASRTVVFALGILLVLGVGGILLQIFLSRRESRWPGLVLPLLSFLWALVLALNAADTGSAARNVLAVLAALLAGNIPTLVLLAVYWASREKGRIRAQMEKMGRRDLEDL